MRQTFRWGLVGLLAAALYCSAAELKYEPFVITVTDAVTGRGVPLVELKTVNKISYYTDANGHAAFLEPGLMGVGDVYFHVTAPAGYETLPADSFGYQGKALRPRPGGTAQFTLTPLEGRQDVISEYSELQRFRLAHPYNITVGTYAPFMITITDADSGRGVPLVELKTRDGLCFYTDSAGRIAFYEPDLMDREVVFHVKSFGYAAPPGETVTLTTTSGGAKQVAIKRINLAERLYRITGGGIYRDSVLLGQDVPLSEPLLSGKVLGQDTVAMTEYKGKLFWLWGDTDRPAYPLGNFKTSSAISHLPGASGLDPDEGVNLRYFMNRERFCKSMFPREDANLVWMSTLISVDSDGKERLVASYCAMDSSRQPFEKGIAVFDDESRTFRPLVKYESKHHVLISSHAFKKDGYIYVNCPYPTIRVKADLASFCDPMGHEAFTCLVPGTGYQGADSKVQRDTQNRLVWGWKRNTAPLDDTQWGGLVKAGLVEESERWNGLRDVQTGKPVKMACGSAVYNACKDCWVMIVGQQFGKSFLGEVWVAAAPAPQGPWRRARKIVTHYSPEEVYTFYNVQQHPEFEREQGRYIYFEGTYVTTYCGNPNPTPRYDYNQMMYRLDLSDSRLDRIWPAKR